MQHKENEMAELITIEKTIGETVYRFKKFNAMQGVKLAKMLASKVLKGVDGNGLISLVKGVGDSNKDVSEMSYSELFETINVETIMNSLSSILENLSDEELDLLATRCLTNVSVVLPVGATPVMDVHGNYLVQNIEYNPQLFMLLIFEEIKWGLSDFFTGSNWKIFQTASLISPISQ